MLPVPPRDILQRRATSVVNGAFAEVEGQPSTAEGDAFDPNVIPCFQGSELFG